MRRFKPWLIILFLSLPAAGHAELTGIGNEKLQSLLNAGVPVIDVRRADEWAELGIVEGSHLMTFFDKEGRYDAKAWFDTFSNKVDTDQPFVLICHSGTRTSIIGKWLGKQLDEVYHLEDGITGWIDEKRPVVSP